MGFLGGVDDNNVYLGLMRQARDGAWLFTNNFKAEPSQPTLFNLLYLVLGKTSRYTGLPLLAVHYLFGALSTLLFVAAAHRFFSGAFRDPRFRAAGVALSLFASGLFGLMEISRFLFGRGLPTVDSWLVELGVFYSILIYPHFVFAAALLTLSVDGFLRSLAKERWVSALVPGLICSVLVFSHAFEVILVVGIVGVLMASLFLRDGLRRWRPRVACLAAFLAPVAAALLGTRTMLRGAPYWREVVWRLNFPAPDPLTILLGTGLTAFLVLLFFAAGSSGRPPSSATGRRDWLLLARCWLVALLLLLYQPSLPWQWHLLNGIQVPLSLLALEGVRRYAILGRPALRGLAAAARHRFAWLTGRRVVALLLTLLCFAASLSSLALLRWHLVLPKAHLARQLYMPRWDLEAIAWLESHTAPADLVLAAPRTANFIPRLSGNRVMVGEDLLTPDYPARSERVRRFYASPDDDRLALLREFGVDYLFHGTIERQLGDWDPAAEDFLERTFTNDGAAIYRILPLPLVETPTAPSPETR